MEERPEWMSDPLVKDISLSKLEFLGSLVTGGKGKSQKELMSFFMLRMKEARQSSKQHNVEHPEATRRVFAWVYRFIQKWYTNE